jgi:hypothetical protein
MAHKLQRRRHVVITLGGIRVKGLSHEIKTSKKHLSQSDLCGCIWLTSYGRRRHVVITLGGIRVKGLSHD